MGEIIGIIVVIVFLAFLFVPMASLTNNQFEVGEIKASLNLSAKALINNIEVEFENLEAISQGFARNQQSQEILINKEKLLRDFYDVLYKNYYDEGFFNAIKDRLIVKVLVMKDRFYVADLQDKWSPPYYFIHYDSGTMLNLSIINNNVYYYNSAGQRVYESMENYGITGEVKNQIIIDKINTIVGLETATYSRGGEMAIEIFNPDKQDMEYNRIYRNFNVLDGITFFVIYLEDSEIGVNGLLFQHRNYNVVGYTLR